MNTTWQQLRTPNLTITYTGGLCLVAVRTALGIAAKYPTAMDDWNAGKQLGGQPPLGIAAPVYFSLTKVSAGHVAIRLSDGRVASSTQSGTHKGLQIHPNIDDLIKVYSTTKNGTCRLLGWSTEVNDVPVVEERNNDVTQTQLDDEMNKLRRFYEGVMVDTFVEVLMPGKKYAPEIRQQKVSYISNNPGGQVQVMKDIMNAEGWSRKADNAGIIAKLQSMIDSLKGGG